MNLEIHRGKFRPKRAVPKRRKKKARPNPTQQSLAFTIVATRNAMGMNQGQLAKKAGMKQSRMSEIEGCRGNPSLSTLVRTGDALGLKLAFVPK